MFEYIIWLIQIIILTPITRLWALLTGTTDLPWVVVIGIILMVSGILILYGDEIKSLVTKLAAFFDRIRIGS